MDRISAFLRRQSRLQLFIEVFALGILVGLIDYLTGYDVTIYPFYSIPILIMVWFGDMKLAVVISVLSTVSWWWADKAVRPPIRHGMATALGSDHALYVFQPGDVRRLGVQEATRQYSRPSRAARTGSAIGTGDHHHQ